MRTFTAIFLAAGSILLGLHASPAAAGSAAIQSRYTQAFRGCPGFDSGVTPEILACIAAEFEIQDKRLNAAYAKALSGLSAPRKTKLRSAQRAWMAYRDAWCGVTYDADSGQQEHIDSNQCMLDETIAQTIRLEELAQYQQ